MAVVIHSVCADATMDHEPVERSSSSSSAFRCVVEPLGDGAGAQPVGHDGEHGAALALLRLGQRGQVVALVGDHLRQPDADGPDGRRQGPGGLLRPAVRRAEDVRDPLVRLRLGRRTSGRF